MTFRPDLAAAVMAGEKTVTRRPASENPRSPWFQDRDRWPETVAVQPGRGQPALGRARIVSAVLMRLGRIGPAEAEREGFASPQEFERQWAAFHGVYDPQLLVWRVELAVDGADGEG